MFLVSGTNSMSADFTSSRLNDAIRTSELYNGASAMGSSSVYQDGRCTSKYGYIGSISSPTLGRFHVFDYSYYHYTASSTSYGYNSSIPITRTSSGIQTFADNYCDPANSKYLLNRP